MDPSSVLEDMQLPRAMRHSLHTMAACPCLLRVAALLPTQVRTVAAFGMEQATVASYDRALELPEKVSC